MTDPTTPPVVETQPAQLTTLQRFVRSVARFVSRNLTSNRLVLYLTGAADVLAAALAVANDLDLTQVAGIAGPLVLLTAKALAFVKGHQQMESALYQRDLIAFNASAQADAAARAAQAAQSVGRAGSGPKLNLPR